MGRPVFSVPYGRACLGLDRRTPPRLARPLVCDWAVGLRPPPPRSSFASRPFPRDLAVVDVDLAAGPLLVAFSYLGKLPSPYSPFAFLILPVSRSFLLASSSSASSSAAAAFFPSQRFAVCLRVLLRLVLAAGPLLPLPVFPPRLGFRATVPLPASPACGGRVFSGSFLPVAFSSPFGFFFLPEFRRSVFLPRCVVIAL